MTMAWSPPIRRVKRAGILSYTPEAMKKILDIPDECNIMHVLSDINRGGIVQIVVESPYLNEVDEGAMIPVVTLSQVTGYDE
jgi:hypothetical protein